MIMNLQGGCAIEVIRPTSFEPKPAMHAHVGDLGICVTQVKCKDIQASHNFCKENKAPGLTPIAKDPIGRATFYMQDLDGLHWQFIESNQWYTKGNHHSGGVIGCSVGVSNMREALELYAGVLGFDKVLIDTQSSFSDWTSLPGGTEKFHRVILTQSAQPGGGFAKVTGSNFIELVQALDRQPNYLFKDRIWGDSMFAHIGFDVKGMKAIGEDLKAVGYPFTCDSNNALSMGQTKVHCTYIHDKDRTLIEMIEVYKVPIIEKWGIFLDVEKRDPLKPLPDFMLKALRFSRVKD
jgi:catechol 2,3-dioxygenase-like lactoylglutathione lyase family enzyme